MLNNKLSDKLHSDRDREPIGKVYQIFDTESKFFCKFANHLIGPISIKIVRNGLISYIPCSNRKQQSNPSSE